MMTRFFLILLVGSLPPAFGASAASTPSAEPVAAAAEAQTKKKPDKQRMRCKSYRPSGTRFDKRVCFTLEEWERRREESREAMKEIQNKPQVCITGHAYCPGGG